MPVVVCCNFILFDFMINLHSIWIPVCFLHFPGASGIGGLVGSFTHSNPSSHEPQSLPILGLKHGPHASPSFFLAGACYEKLILNFKHLSLIYIWINIIVGYNWDWK